MKRIGGRGMCCEGVVGCDLACPDVALVSDIFVGRSELVDWGSMK